MVVLYIICALIVGFVLGIAVVAWRAGVMIDIERVSCAASKKRLKDENIRLYSEIEELQKKLNSRKNQSL